MYCKNCTLELFAEWRGVPWRDLKKWPPSAQRRHPKLPKLPNLIEGNCPKCGGDDTLLAEDIAYFNVGSGLPEYWALVVQDDAAIHLPIQEMPLEGIALDRITWCHDRFGYPYPNDYEDQNE